MAEPFSCWVYKPGWPLDIWLLNNIRLNYWSPSFFLEASHRVLWEKLFIAAVQGWLGSRWTNGSLQPLSTAWISQKVLWKVTHASALILTVWISQLIWHITHHLYMYIIIENVSIKKKYLVLFSHHPRSKWSLRFDVNLGGQPWNLIFPIISQETQGSLFSFLLRLGLCNCSNYKVKHRSPRSGLDDGAVIFVFPTSPLSLSENQADLSTRLPHRRAGPSLIFIERPLAAQPYTGLLEGKQIFSHEDDFQI